MDPPGRESEAEDDFRHALGLNPLVQGAKRGLGIAAMRRGDYRSALALLEQARAEDPAVSVDAEISQCRLRL